MEYIRTYIQQFALIDIGVNSASSINRMMQSPYNFSDQTRFEALKRIGESFVQCDQIDKLRSVVNELLQIQITENIVENMFNDVNIIKG